jgi:Sulfotransferase family
LPAPRKRAPGKQENALPMPDQFYNQLRARIQSSQGPLSLDDRLIFMHFPKTAGVTVRNCLAPLFDPAEICPEGSDAISLWPSEITRQYRYFACHAKFVDFRFIPPPMKMITFLRNPIARSFSNLDYWLSLTDAAIAEQNLFGPRLAKSLGVRDFYAGKNYDQCSQYWNFYTRWLVDDPCLAPSGRLWSSAAEVIDHALKNLESMAFVGISEDLTTSFARLCERLDIPNHYHGQTDNVTKSNHEHNQDHDSAPVYNLDQELFEIVANANQLDMMLYNHAVRKFYKDGIVRRQITCLHNSPPACRARTGQAETWVQNLDGGFVLLGPYMRLFPARYTAGFRLRKQVNAAPFTEDDLGYADVTADRSLRNLAIKPILAKDIGNGITTIQMTFDATSPLNECEFRVFLKPSAAIEVSQVVTLAVDASGSGEKLDLQMGA